MFFKPDYKKTSGRFKRWGLWWQANVLPASMHMDMIRRGGRFANSKGELCGEGLAYHMREFQKIIFPEKQWHRWNEKQLECFLNYRTIVILGPASSGKTNAAATDFLADWYCFSHCTTVLCCSTTKERLEDRVWGEIKKYHRMATSIHDWLPGYLIEGRMRIVNDDRMAAAEGRDFRNGLLGVPCRTRTEYLGLGDFIGIKNKRVRLLGDELHLLPKTFVDALANLDKNPGFKCQGMGNPKETTDALGVLAEPAAHLGGWDGGVDQGPGTKTWETRRPNGICLQLVGSDSPNLDGTMSIPLITQQDIDRDIAFYGKESLQFTMMNEGKMPRGQGARRVLTRQMCQKFGAMESPNWLNENRTRIAFLDAAYRGVGGDRCVFGELQFGAESTPPDASALVASIISQKPDDPKRRNIIALIDTVIVPIKDGLATMMPEDQIVQFVKEQCTYRKIPPENLYFDAGMRTSLVQAFSRLWSPAVNSVDCGGRATETSVSADIKTLCRDYYSKFITELWFSVNKTVESKQFRGMTEEVLMEFCSREWQLVSGNKIEVEPKSKMKEKTGRSPDLADAVAVGIYGARRRGFVIARMVAPEPRKKGERDWRTTLMEQSKSVWKSGTLQHAA